MRRLLVAVALLPSCGGSKTDDGPAPSAPRALTTTCGATHEAIGPACVPRFDACGANEVPRVGGGCTPVGVNMCAEGMTSDGAGGCNASLPACAPGELALPGDACAPIARCDAPIPGGALVVDKDLGAAITAAPSGATLYLAAGEYVGDVVVDKPLTIVGRCPAMVTVRGTITLRAPATIRSLSVTGSGRGIFAEGVSATLDSIHAHDLADIALGGRDKEGPLTLTIRRVLIERVGDAGIATTGGTVTIDDALVRDVTNGSGVLEGYGILASGSSATMTPGDVRITRVAVENTAFAGIAVVGAKVAVTRALVRNAGTVAIGHPGGTPIPAPLTVMDSIVEDHAGIGIAANRATTFDVARVTVRRTKSTGILVRDVPLAWLDKTRVDRAAGRGITIDLSNATIHSTFVSGTTDRDGQGCGICGFTDKTHKLSVEDAVVRDNRLGGVGTDGPELSLRRVLVEGNRGLGVSVVGGTASLEGVVVRSTTEADGARGDGLLFSSPPWRAATLTLRDALFEGNTRSAVALFMPATLERVRIRDTRAGKSGIGVGVYAVPATDRTAALELTLRDVVVERAVGAGVYFEATNAKVESSVVRDVVADSSGNFGDGIAMSASELSTAMGVLRLRSSLELRRTLVERSSRAAISLFGSSATLLSSRLHCNVVDLDVEDFLSERADTRDLGDNDCACAPSTFKTCRAQSNGLRPIAARE